MQPAKFALAGVGAVAAEAEGVGKARPKYYPAATYRPISGSATGALVEEGESHEHDGL